MKRQRRQYSADWKAKVALEAVKGQRTIQQIVSHYEVHPRMVMHWKKQLLEGAEGGSLTPVAYGLLPLGYPRLGIQTQLSSYSRREGIGFVQRELEET